MKRLILIALLLSGCATAEFTKSPDGSMSIKYKRLWTTSESLNAEVTKDTAKVTSKGQKVELTPEQAAAILNVLLGGKP